MFWNTAETAKAFFGSDKVGFAAVDGTEYTRPMFDLVIFLGGSYAEDEVERHLSTILGTSKQP
jgi:hypothetical protein